MEEYLRVVAIKLFELTQLAYIRCDADILKLTAGAQSIYREVYAYTYICQAKYQKIEL